MIEVPLNSSPEQLFSIITSGETYDCRVILNSRTGVWSISLSQSGVELLRGIALVGGIDIFNQYNISIENAYVVNLDKPNLDPSKTNLGIIARLFILTDEEVGNE
tara:strand:- start:90 stop:404 length:315 start_codon:yes stop_codon:yes gene_type:complete